jgi:hypothetical protein
VGGPASPIRFGAEEAARLLRRVIELHRGLGGSILVACGPRTPISVRAILEAGLPEGGKSSRVFGWPPPVPPTPNPYPALLALCDRFLVTSDSASMIADAGITDKPLELFILPESHRRLSWRGLGLSIDARRRARARQGLAPDLRDRFRDFLVHNRLMVPYRDMRDLLHVLRRAGIVDNLERTKAGIGRALQQQELTRVGVRIAGLLQDAARRQAGKIQAGKIQAGKIQAGKIQAGKIQAGGMRNGRQHDARGRAAQDRG